MTDSTHEDHEALGNIKAPRIKFFDSVAHFNPGILPEGDSDGGEGPLDDFLEHDSLDDFLEYDPTPPPKLNGKRKKARKAFWRAGSGDVSPAATSCPW